MVDPDYGDPTHDHIQFVYAWLINERNGNWLMIVDGVDSSELFSRDHTGLPALSTYIPQSHNGSVLVTSRNQTGNDLVDSLETVISVEKLDIETASSLILNTLPNADVNSTKQLANALDFIPLAMKQAAAYIAWTKIDVERYLKVFWQSEQDQTRLLGQECNNLLRDPNVPNSIITSLKISFDQIKKDSTKASHLLAIMSFLEHEGIQDSLIYEEEKYELEHDEALGLLQGYSLIWKEDKRLTSLPCQSYAMHRLVQVCIRCWLVNERTSKGWHELALAMVSNKFPQVTRRQGRECDFMMPHAQKVLDYRTHYAKLVDSALKYEWLLGTAVLYYAAKGRPFFQQSQSNLQQLLTHIETQCGPDHLNCARLKRTLAKTVLHHGHYDKAKLLYDQVLAAIKSQGLAEPPEMSIVENHHANVMLVWSMANDLIGQAQRSCELMISPKSMIIPAGEVDQIEAVNQVSAKAVLAFINWRQERKSKAEKLIEEILQDTYNTVYHDIEERVSALPQNLGSMFCVLAPRLRVQLEQLRKYEGLYEVLLCHQRQVNEPSDTYSTKLDIISRMTELKMMQSHYAEATEVQNQAVAAIQLHSANIKASTVIAVHQMSMLYRLMDFHESIKHMYERFLTSCEGPPGHVDIATHRVVRRLASLLAELERYGEAESLLKKILKVSENQLSEQHEDAIATARNLADVYYVQERYNEARPLLEKVLDFQEVEYGANHPLTVPTAGLLSRIYVSLDRYADAKRFASRAFYFHVEQHGIDDEETQSAMYLMLTILRRLELDDEVSKLKQTYNIP